MNLLLDTHTFLWFVWADPQLSATAEAAITNPRNRKLISTASYWEIAIKVSVGKLDLGEPYRAFMNREMTRNNFEILPLTIDQTAILSTLPFHHRDPFDRAIIGQAIWEEIPVVSADAAFDDYPITRLW